MHVYRSTTHAARRLSRLLEGEGDSAGPTVESQYITIIYITYGMLFDFKHGIVDVNWIRFVFFFETSI